MKKKRRRRRKFSRPFASDSFIYYHFGPENFSMAESGSNCPTKLVDTLAIGPRGFRISPPSTAEALIHKLIEETDHLISSATVIDDDGHYFAFVKLDANIQNTCFLYAYDADADTIKKLYEWDNVSFLGLSIPENKTGNDMLINIEKEPKTADDVIRFVALKGGNTLDFDYFNYLQHRNIFETSSCVCEYDLSGGDSLYISGADFLTPKNINIVKADGTRLHLYNSAPSENSENQDYQIGIRTLDGDMKFSSVYINTMAQGLGSHCIKDEASVTEKDAEQWFLLLSCRPIKNKDCSHRKRRL